jgi:3-phosphoshikimate 1-carboxyvinyltransferase
MLEVSPICHLDATLSMPGSKSYSQRALIIAALGEGKSCLHNALISEDTYYLIGGLSALGAEISISEDKMVVTGTGGIIKNPSKEIFLGNNGTALRFLMSLVCLGEGKFILTGDQRLCERPIKPLLDALQTLGASIYTEKDAGYPPVTIEAGGIKGGAVTFSDIESSQYISSLLISSPYSREGVKIRLQGKKISQPYIEMTLKVMRDFGIKPERTDNGYYCLKGGQKYLGREYQVESDVSSASYFFLAAALSRGRVRVRNIDQETLQGDIRIIVIMRDLGCSVRQGMDWIELTGGALRGGEYIVDMGDMPDMVPTLAVLAAFRPGRTVVQNVSHLRLKESNRLSALASELRRIGIEAEETQDGLIIDGGHPHGAEVETYNDHRIAMSFAVAGLVTSGMRIKNEQCVQKSFPGFWEELKKL